MVSINPSKLVAKAYDCLPKPVAKVGDTLSETVSKDIEMVAKRLELATLKDGADRFNQQDIKTITKALSEYKTEASVYDLSKEILAIGSQKGEAMSVKEITDFLEATSGMKPEEQQKVLKFINGLKSQDKVEYNKDYIMKTWNFEDFKEQYLEGLPDWHSHKNGVDDETLMKLFNDQRNREIELTKYSSFKEDFKTGPVNSSLYVSKNMASLVKEGILKCDDPETLGELIVKLKVGQYDMNITYASQDLIDAYKLSGKNEYFTQDIIRGFYPAEVKEIVATLKAKGKLSPENFKDYKWNRTRKKNNDGTGDQSLAYQRRLVLKSLGINDEIKLLPLETHQDLYAGQNRGTKITGGNFERGKRK